MKIVSVVIPVYNTGSIMRRCFESLVAQTIGKESIEVIVVDDGSTDMQTLDIIREYEHSYPETFRVLTKKNGGQGSARNLAFHECTGEYITCLDSDDCFHPQWIEKMYGTAKDQDADFVGCGYKAVRYENGQEVVVRAMDMRPICSDNREMFIDANVSMFTTLFKRTVLEESGAKYPEGCIYEDTAFFIELLPWIRKPVYIEEALSVRTLHEGSTMTNAKPEKVADIFKVFEALIKCYEEKGLRKEYKNELEYFIGKVLLCSSLNRIGFVKSYGSRRKLVKETYLFLHRNVPEFRNNPYIKRGVKGFYLKHYNKILMNLAVELLRFRFIIKRDYNS
jgi:hypothetical protein